MRCHSPGRGNANGLMTVMLVHVAVAMTLSAAAFANPLSAATARFSGDESGHDRYRRSVLSPLGKRLTSNLVAELGKRPRQLYSFGIGKRSISDKDMAEFMADEERGKGDNEVKHAIVEKRSPFPGSYYELPADLDFGQKRNPYAFGLGKRDPYSFGLGKRDPYSFGLGKRDPYSFGLGKRDPYSFGLGKRDPYSFGLGKRDPYSFGLGKRDPYSFGLGKRASN